MNQTTDQFEMPLASRYRIERELGTGATATVYLAHDLRHDRVVAVKVLRPELAAVLGPDRFLNEIRVTARLNHPNIVALFDSGEADGSLYYVMPAIEGETLRQKLEREGQLSIEEAIYIAAAIGQGLAYAHEHGVIHRDIKPENILLHRGVAQIADFGIAAAIERAGRDRVTATGISLGTPRYMSPEQFTGDRTIDPRSDIYALGVVLYEMLAGDPPFVGSNTQGVMARVLHEPPTSVRLIRQTISPELDAVIDRSLAKVPADRFSTAADFVAALGHPQPTRSGSHIHAGSEVSPPGLAKPLQFLAELNRRRVVRAAVWFGGAAFALLEATPNILRAFSIRDSGIDRVTSIEVITLLVAFPIVIALAWIFEFTGEGKLRREGSVTGARGSSRMLRIITATAMLVILVATGALLTRTWRALTRESLTPQRLVVMPLRFAAPDPSGKDADVLLHDAFLPWRGIEVRELVTGPLSPAQERELALASGAGRFVRGTVTNVGAMQRLYVALLDTRADTVLADTTVQFGSIGPNSGAMFKDLATWLLFRGAGVRDVELHTPIGTTSYSAALSFLRGQQALLGWAVDSAAVRFADALTTDPQFTRAALWLMQAQNWNGVDAASNDLRPLLDRMSAGMPALSTRERQIAEGLRKLGRREYSSACGAYAALVAADSQDFAGWYGTGECQMRDKLVVADVSSPSGWSFRSSMHAALEAYRRAFLLLTERQDLATRTVDVARRFFYTSSNHYRDGYTLQPVRVDFVARPELAADTIGFTPYRRADFAAGRVAPRSTANALALDRQRAAFNDIARAWARSFPRSPRAMQALAVAQEVQGELRNALETLRKARVLAADDIEQRTELGVGEVILLVRLGAPDGVTELTRARALADSLLASPDAADPDGRLAVVAALTGQVDRAAQTLFAAARPDTPEVDVIIPEAFTAPARALLAYAAMGGPGDRIVGYENDLDQVLRNRLRGNAGAALHPALDQVASLAFPHHPLTMSVSLAADSVYPLLQAQVAFARGDTASSRRILGRIRVVRGGARPAELPFDALYPEAALHAALGDTDIAAAMLDATLGDLTWTEPGALAHFESAASLIQAMILRADIAARSNQPAVAARWARAVSILWSNADRALQPVVKRMETLTSNGSRL
ncbi:MAG: serine/threonine-protein kinase [Longimicrobiales bacterium]